MAGSVPIGGLFEAHLAVSDLGRSVAFYRDDVGLTLGLEEPERGAAFFWVGEAGAGLLGLWSLGSAPMAVVSHVAFRVSLPHVLEAGERLRAAGITPLSFFGDETEEPSVIAWMPAAATYFRDPDGHLLEYLAMLEGSGAPARGILSWSEWIADHDTDTGSAGAHLELYRGRRDALRGLFEMAEDSAALLDSYLDAGDVLVAVEGDVVVGHLQLLDTPDPHVSEIKNMAVVTSSRGRGIGHQLVDAAASLAEERGRGMLVVGTAAANVGNLRFYQRVGFRLRSIERDAFLAATGYAPMTSDEGIELRDRVWLDYERGAPQR